MPCARHAGRRIPTSGAAGKVVGVSPSRGRRSHGRTTKAHWTVRRGRGRRERCHPAGETRRLFSAAPRVVRTRGRRFEPPVRHQRPCLACENVGRSPAILRAMLINVSGKRAADRRRSTRAPPPRLRQAGSIVGPLARSTARPERERARPASAGGKVPADPGATVPASPSARTRLVRAASANGAAQGRSEGHLRGGSGGVLASCRFAVGPWMPALRMAAKAGQAAAGAIETRGDLGG
jgi:hypothetical protein